MKEPRATVPILMGMYWTATVVVISVMLDHRMWVHAASWVVFPVVGVWQFVRSLVIHMEDRAMYWRSFLRTQEEESREQLRAARRAAPMN
jgi:hypothetical protein